VTAYYLFAVVFLVVGLASLVAPRQLLGLRSRSWFGLGYTGELEPSSWRVAFARLVGVAFIVLGLSMLVGRGYPF